MEKFTRIISLEGQYAYNAIGETFYITEDLFPFTVPCIISYNDEHKSSITRSTIESDAGELFYTIIVKHAQRAFRSTEELAEYRHGEWNRELVIVEYHAKELYNEDFSHLIESI